jgi:hypothetical protein
LILEIFFDVSAVNLLAIDGRRNVIPGGLQSAGNPKRRQHERGADQKGFPGLQFQTQGFSIS